MVIQQEINKAILLCLMAMEEAFGVFIIVCLLLLPPIKCCDIIPANGRIRKRHGSL